MTARFNLRALAIAATGKMPIRDAVGEVQKDEAGNPLTITFHSPGSKAFQKAKHAAEQRNNDRVMARMQGKSEAKLSAEDKAAERAEFLAACTISIDGADLDGQSGHEAFKALYSDLELGHIADDADKFLADRGNFKQGSATA
ncbi:MAG: hypothetical protein PGN26_14595 [Xylophilus ampelinus]